MNMSSKSKQLSRTEAALVQKYFELIFYRRLGPSLSRQFYAHLFRLAPDLRAIFPEDMTRQNRKLARSVQTIIEVLPDLDTIDRHFVRLAKAHRPLNLTEQDFDLFTRCLILALQDLLQEEMIMEARLALRHTVREVSRRILGAPKQKKSA
jgi:nitric oxide dioxygenase